MVFGSSFAYESMVLGAQALTHLKVMQVKLLNESLCLSD